MKNRFILSLLFIAFGFLSNINAQVGYEVQWHCKGVTYNGLIWETGYYNQYKMRVVYSTGCGSSMIEQDLMQTSDDIYGYFIGSNPRFLAYCNADQTYAADSFRWYGNTTETMDSAGNWSVVHYLKPIYTWDRMKTVQNARYRRR